MGGVEVEAKPVRRGFTAEDILRPEFLMIIAAILMIIGAFGKWTSWGGAWGVAGWSASGWDMASGKVTIFIGSIMLYSSVVNLGYIRFMERMVPVLSVSAICGSIALVLALSAWSSFAGGGWGLYLTIVASLIALLAAFRAFMGAGTGFALRRGGPSGGGI